MRFECVSRTHVGLRRKINEDAMLAVPERGLWAVADGMGGHDAGEVASTMVVDALRCLPPARGADELAHAAVAALRQVNGELIALARSGDGNGKRTIGTTVVGLAVGEADFRCFWAGDSRAYQLSGDAFRRLTRDHSLVQEMVDAGMLTAEEAESHESSNLITRAVGAADTIEIEMVRGDARAGDLFLLASDGLTGVVSDDELAAELKHAAPDVAADRLIEMVLARGAPDNVSLIITRLS
jgi:serine/threonine protein phosphatase PrpC